MQSRWEISANLQKTGFGTDEYGGGGESNNNKKKTKKLPFSAPFALERTWLISWLREAISLRSSSFSVITDCEKK